MNLSMLNKFRKRNVWLICFCLCLCLSVSMFGCGINKKARDHKTDDVTSQKKKQTKGFSREEFLQRKDRVIERALQEIDLSQEEKARYDQASFDIVDEKYDEALKEQTFVCDVKVPISSFAYCKGQVTVKCEPIGDSSMWDIFEVKASEAFKKKKL